MSVIMNENKFDLVLKVARYQRVMRSLKIKGNDPYLKKVDILDKSIEKSPIKFSDEYNEYLTDNLSDYPISEEMISMCIAEDESQTLWQLAIRISEYNGKNINDNYRILEFLMKKLPDGFFVYSKDYYKSLNNLIHWVPDEK